MESLSTDGKQQPSVLHQNSNPVVYNSFSWLDEDDDLDLRLTLDDCHDDMKSTPRPLTTTGPTPVYRRRLSVNKLSFGLSSNSSSRPGTKDSSCPEPAPISHHSRRKSRALSLITPKHAQQPSVTSIDPDAAHYQDPVARHKLRAYLASPQKFDEALQFGFPSNNTRPAIPPGALPRKSRSFSQDLFMASSEKLKTFLADDQSSIYSEEVSIPDSESPRTPHTPDILSDGIKPFHLPMHSATFPSKLSEENARGPGISREMTLRMTLTRPDLRSCQEQLYGEDPRPRPRLGSRQASRSSYSQSLRAVTPVSVPDTKDTNNPNMDKVFADIDRELASSPDGLLKRFLKRVRLG